MVASAFNTKESSSLVPFYVAIKRSIILIVPCGLSVWPEGHSIQASSWSACLLPSFRDPSW